MKETQVHVPVLVSEMIEALRPRPSGVYLDGTLGAGGHAQAILEASRPDGAVIGLDMDPEAVLRSRERLALYGERFKPVHGGYQDAQSILAALGFDSVDGIVLDLGLSSDQVDDLERGFSFRGRGPLDMRFDTTSELTVTEYLDRLSVHQLEEILATYGEERYCKKLARGIIRARDRGELKTTRDLAELVTSLTGGRRGKIHPATRTFQALRIALNRELDNLAGALDKLPDLLRPRARFCIVSYHSLEDRLVKHSFRDRSKGSAGWVVLTPRPIRPSEEEIRSNPRARSARMRVLEASGGDHVKDASRRGASRSASNVVTESESCYAMWDISSGLPGRYTSGSRSDKRRIAGGLKPALGRSETASTKTSCAPACPGAPGGSSLRATHVGALREALLRRDVVKVPLF